MKKTAITKYTSWVVGLLILAAGACSPAERLLPDGDGEHQCPLQLVGGVIPFDGANTKSSGTFTYSKDNRLYVRLVGAAGAVLGQATYDEETGWSLTYNGSLAGATTGAAHAVLIEKDYSETSLELSLNYYTPIYEDHQASFTVDENGFSLHATLTPKTGRISFVHDLEEGQSRSFNRAGGISYYTSFSLSTFSFQSQDISKVEGFSLKRGETRPGEYIYGFFTDEEAPRIMLHYFINNLGNRYSYKFLPQDALEPGKSGYVDMPDINPSGWQKYSSSLHFNVNDNNGGYAYFEMDFVPSGSFRMGNDEDPTAQPAHPVTLKPYYIGSKEVTQALWYVVMGEPSDWQGKDLPVYNRSYEEIQKFITALQAFDETSKYRFRLPTEAEWEFAARGGIFSHGYSYSGGNTLSAVAVRQTEYAIGSKNTNELSIWDMSGDVAELCADWYGPYPAEAQVNPSGPASGEFRVVRGGNSYDPDEYFTVWHRASTDEYGGLPSSFVGFRLVMEAPVIEVE